MDVLVIRICGARPSFQVTLLSQFSPKKAVHRQKIRSMVERADDHHVSSM
jgi:hypothetical protein